MPNKRPTPSAQLVDRALKLAEDGWSGPDIDQKLCLKTRSTGGEVLRISDRVQQDIIRGLFGSNTRIAHSTQLTPLTTHGIQRRGGFTGNLVYKVVLEHPHRALVLRFNRGLREDVYDQEFENYALVKDATGIPGPEIIHIDRSLRLAPSEFMVMEYIPGELADYLVHPNNPDLGLAEKKRIRQATGHFYAALHKKSRQVKDEKHETRRLLLGLYRLSDVCRSEPPGIDAMKIRACIDAFNDALVLRSATETLCFLDGELVFSQRDGHWEPVYVCDLEWVGYRDRQTDLLSQLSPLTPLWSLRSPGISDEKIEAAQRDPFFKVYRQTHPVDWQRLSSIVPYHQLALWGHAIADLPTASMQKYLLAQRSDLISVLMRRVLS